MPVELSHLRHWNLHSNDTSNGVVIPMVFTLKGMVKQSMENSHMFIAAICLFGLLIPSGAMAASLGVTIRNATAAAGSTIDIPVEVSGAQNLGSMDLLISYNASVLSATSVDKGSLVKGMISANTNTPGYVSIAIIDSGGMTGMGQLAVIHFKVIGSAGTKSPLSITNALAYDVGTHIDIPVTSTSSLFTVKGGSGGWSVPGFGALAAILGLFGIIYLFRRAGNG